MSNDQKPAENKEKAKKQDAAVAASRTRITPAIAKEHGLDPVVYGGKKK